MAVIISRWGRTEKSVVSKSAALCPLCPLKPKLLIDYRATESLFLFTKNNMRRGAELCSPDNKIPYVAVAHSYHWVELSSKCEHFITDLVTSCLLSRCPPSPPCTQCPPLGVAVCLSDAQENITQDICRGSSVVLCDLSRSFLLAAKRCRAPASHNSSSCHYV